MNHDNLVHRLKKLADEGELLLQSGYELSADAPPPSAVFNWLIKSNNLLADVYGKDSSVMKEFKEAYTIRMSVNLLVSLAANEIHHNNLKQQSNRIPQQLGQTLNQSPDTELSEEQAKRISLIIDTSVLPEKRTYARRLFESVWHEVASSHPRWEIVSSSLKAGFDYGIPFGAELVKFAYLYYNSKKSVEQ